MAVTPGRNNRLYGWNAYEWPSTYRYVAGGWTVTPVAAIKSMTVTLTPPAAYVGQAGARMGYMFGTRSNQGYDGKSNDVSAAAAVPIRVLDLLPGQPLYLMPVLIAANGDKICGPQSGPVTPL
jgi:hypothetical protein